MTSLGFHAVHFVNGLRESTKQYHYLTPGNTMGALLGFYVVRVVVYLYFP